LDVHAVSLAGSSAGIWRTARGSPEWLKRHPWAKPGIRFWMDSRIRSMEKQITLKEAF
jgi:hypothetical protein